MKDSILSKLEEELLIELKRESQVLYIVAEIRKLIEHRKEEGLRGHSELKFYCNWALHIRIDKDDTNVTQIFDGVDILEGVSFDDYVRSSFYNYISNFALLRAALGTFLEEHGLPKDIAAKDHLWDSFVFLFCGVVSEVPLVYNGAAKNPQTIKQLTMTRKDKDEDGQFSLTWTAKLFSGEECGVITRYPQRDVEYDWWSGQALGWQD